MTPLPSRIGRYEVVNRLGRGGMGVVYLAKDPALERTVAIKMLTEDNEELRERFAREARSAAALDHSNIVTIYDVGEHNGQPFIAMKYLDGETMAEMIKRRAPIPVRRKLELMLELCEGLGYAHRRGIVHRDIKPANLMITTEGTLKILDFGIARVTAEATHSGLTRVGALMGSLNYMSPEQAEGLPVDVRSDIFSVGLVIYELLSFSRAFAGELPHVVLNNIITRDPAPLRELCPDLDEELERIVSRALVKSPEGRYQTLADVAADLERVQRDSEKTGDTRIIDRGPSGVQGRPKTGGSGSEGLRWSLAIDQRRSALIESHLQGASAHFDAERYHEALEECEKALVISPEESRGLALLRRIQRALEERQVGQLVAKARELLSAGALTEAERLVTQALQLQPESAEGQGALRELKERRRDQERAAERVRAVSDAIERARANLDAGAFEAAQRCATEALAFDGDNAEAMRLRQQAREALSARDAKLAHERRAGEVVAQARKFVSNEDVDSALTILHAFSPPHPLVTSALAEVKHAATVLEARRREVREAEEGLRRQKAEFARQEREGADREAAKEEERRRKAAEIVFEPDETLLLEREPPSEVQTRVAPAARMERQESTRETPSSTRSKKPALVAATAAVVIAGVVGWWVLVDPTRPPPPPRPRDYSQVLAEAEKQQGNALAAIALLRTIPANVTESGPADALLGRIRSAEAGAAAAAREKARSAGAATQRRFYSGEAQMQQADALTDLRDTEEAVKLYASATLAFIEAASAGMTLEQLMEEAHIAHRNARSQEAIARAVQAVTRSAGYRPALSFLADRKREAAMPPQAARAKASAAGATAANSPSFREGREKEQEADAIASPLETQIAVDAYARATALYRSAITEVPPTTSDPSKLKRELDLAAQRVNAALQKNDVETARSELARIRERDPQYLTTYQPDLPKRLADLETAGSLEALNQSVRRSLQANQLDRAREDLEKIRTLDANYLVRHPDLEASVAKAEATRKLNEDAATKEAARKQAAGLLQQARAASADRGQAMGFLKEAFELDPGNAEIRLEIAKLEIADVLARFAAEASKGSAGNVNPVCPSCERDFGFTRIRLRAREFQSLAWRFDQLKDTEAKVLWDTRVTQATNLERTAPEMRRYNVTMTRDQRGWIIASIIPERQ